jgi:hypothetical protein
MRSARSTPKSARLVPDFEYIENGKWIVEDVKSEPTITPSFRIKLKLFHANYPSAEFRIIGLNRSTLRAIG